MALVEITDPAELEAVKASLVPPTPLAEVTDERELASVAAAFKSSLTTEDGRFRVIDGDTVEELSTGRKLRLDGINTAESGHNTATDAATELKRQLDATPGATLKVVGEDRYGRTLAEFTDKSGASVNRRLVESGFGGSLDMGGEPGPYRDAANAASLARVGAGVRTPEQQAADERFDASVRAGQPVTAADLTPARPKRTLLQEFGAGVSRGTDQLQGALYGAADLAGQATGVDALGEFGREGYLRNAAEAEERPATIQGIEKIGSVRDALYWASGTLGEVAPSVATAVAGGGVGAVAARRLVADAVFETAKKRAVQQMTERGVARALAVRAVESGAVDSAVGKAAAQALYTAGKRGAAAGVFGTSAAQEAGDIHGELRDAGINAPGTAAIAGLAAGALDSLPALRLMDRVFPGADRAVARNTVSRVVAALGFDQALVEGSTEAAQEAIAIAARAYEDPGYKFNTVENRMRIINAAAAGALVGAIGGAGSNLLTRGRDEGPQPAAPPAGDPAQAVDTSTQATEVPNETADLPPAAVAEPVVPDPARAPEQREFNFREEVKAAVRELLDEHATAQPGAQPGAPGPGAPPLSNEELSAKLGRRFRVTPPRAKADALVTPEASPEAARDEMQTAVETGEALAGAPEGEALSEELAANVDAAPEGLTLVEAGTIVYGKDGSMSVSGDGRVTPYKRGFGSLRKMLRTLREEAKNEGTDSQFEAFRLGDGFAIRETLSPDAQLFSVGARRVTRPAYIRHMAEEAKRTASKQDRRKPGFSKRNPLMRVDDRVVSMSARDVTKLGLDLDAADGAPQTGARRILAGFNRGLSALAGMSDPVVPVSVRRGGRPAGSDAGPSRPVNIDEIPADTVVYSTRSGREWTIAELRKTLRSPEEKLEGVDRALPHAERTAAEASAELRSGAFELDEVGERAALAEQVDTARRMRVTHDALGDQVASERRSGASKVFEQDGALVDIGDRTVERDGETAELSDEENLDDPIKAQDREARKAGRQGVREHTDLATRHKAIRSQAGVRFQDARNVERERGDRKRGGSITADEVAMLRDLADHAQLGVNLDLVDEGGLGNSDADKQTAIDAENGLKGRVWFRGQTLRIFVSEAVTDPAERLAVLAHELGHGVAAAQFHTLPKDHPARSRLETAHKGALAEPNSTANENFEEWLANQFVAWAIRKDTPKNVIEHFFQKVARAVKGLFDRLRARYKLNEEYRDFLDGMIEDLKAKDARKMWVGHGRENFHLPEFVDKSRAMAYARNFARDAGGDFRALAMQWVVPVDTWLRHQKDGQGATITAAVKLANAFHRPPGMKIDDSMSPKDYQGNVIRYGLLEDRVRAMGPWLKRAGEIDRMIVDRFKHLKGKAKKEAIEARKVEVLEAIYAGTPTAEGAAVKSLLRGMHEYLKANIPGLGFIENYVPHVFDMVALEQGHDAFVALVQKHLKINPQQAEEIYEHLYREGGFALDLAPLDSQKNLVRNPAFGFMKDRKLTDIPESELAPFLTKDLSGMLLGYIRSAVKRAEWDRRFGRYTGEEWDSNAGFRELVQEFEIKAAPEQRQRFRQNVAALRGELGADLDPKLRRAMSYMMVYQNFRTLPFSVFASFPDLAGIAVGSRDIATAWHGVVEGLRSTIKAAKGDRDALHEMAEMMGVISEASDFEALQEATSTNFIAPDVRKFNDALFKYNGLQAFTRGTRVMALAAGKRFIEISARRAAQGDKRHTRYLEELGLAHQEVRAWIDAGRPVWGADGITADRSAEKIASALNQFVNRSILRPNAAHRTSWMSDPKWMLIAHLKSFMYSFHEVVLTGIFNEVRNRKGEGLVSQAAIPALALMTLLPLAMAGLALRDLLQYALWGQESHRDVTDVFELMQRAGGLGYAQMAVDVYEAEGRGRMSVLAALGPTISQFEQITSGRSDFLQALPILGSIPGARLAIKDALE